MAIPFLGELFEKTTRNILGGEDNVEQVHGFLNTSSIHRTLPSG
jgi:hypothetical protein